MSESNDIGDHFPHTKRLLEERAPRDESPSPGRVSSGTEPSPSPPRARDAPADDHYEGEAEGEAESAVVAGVVAEDADQPDDIRRRFARLYTRRAEIANTVQERLECAARRRALLQDERRRHLEDAERQRRAKVDRTRALRRAGTVRFLSEALAPLNVMRAAGLVLDVEAPNGPRPLLSADQLEAVLMADPRTCDVCVLPTDLARPVCPHSRKPHRRSLVVAAERFLKLVGDTRVHLVPARIDAVGSSAPASATSKTRRGIAVNPQLFVLAYYNAVLPPGEIDPLLQEVAVTLIETAEQLRDFLEHRQQAPTTGGAVNAGDSVSSDRDADDRDGAYVKPLLVAFSRAWNRYAQLSNQQLLAAATDGDRGEAKQELLQSTVEALKTTYAQLRRLVTAAAAQTHSPSDSPSPGPAADPTSPLSPASVVKETRALSAFIAMMRTRLERIGGPQALEAFDATMAGEEAADMGRVDGEADRDLRGAPTHYSCASLSSAPENSPQVKPTKIKHVDPRPPAIALPPAASNTDLSAVLVASPLLAGTPAPPPTPLTPQRVSAPPPAAPPEYVGTSGSDTDSGGRTVPRRQGPVFGPALPPLWYVDAEGRSQPPSAEMVRQERFSRLEYRARAAYTAKMKRDAMQTRAEAEERLAREAIASAIDGVMWTQLTAELDATPPVLHRLPLVLNALSEALTDALPRRLRARVGQEVRDVLDWDVMRSRIAAATPAQRHESIVAMMAYTINLVGQLGAPAREEGLHARAQTLAAQLTAADPSAPGGAVVDILRFMFEAVRTLRRDIAQYSVQVLSSELAGSAIPFEREFVATCLPPVPEWQSSAAFIQSGVRSAAEAPMIPNPPPVPRAAGGSGPALAAPPPVPVLQAFPPLAVCTDEADRRLLAGLLSGTVDQLRSSGRTTATRWASYPREVLYFSRPILFEGANNVQMITLRLMLVGTAAMVLGPYGALGPATQTFLKSLDVDIGRWLAAVAGPPKQPQPGEAEQAPDADAAEELVVSTVEDLKNALIGAINDFLAVAPRRQLPPVSPPPQSPAALPVLTPRHGEAKALTDPDVQVLRGIVDKLSDTDSAQYGLFESRVLRAVCACALHGLVATASGVGADVPSNNASDLQRAVAASLVPCGALAAYVRTLGATMAAVVLHAWTVHREALTRLLAQPSASATSPAATA